LEKVEFPEMPTFDFSYNNSTDTTFEEQQERDNYDAARKAYLKYKRLGDSTSVAKSKVSSEYGIPTSDMKYW